MTAATVTRDPPVHERYRARLAMAMTVSLLLHTLLLSLQFGIAGVGLPTLELPWRERRAQAVDLNVVLASPAPASPSSAEPPPAAPPGVDTPSPPGGTGLKLVPLPEHPPPAAAVNAPAAAPKRSKATGAAAPRRKTPRARKETPVIALSEPREHHFTLPAPALDEIRPEPESEVPHQAAASAVTTQPAPALPAGDASSRQGEQAMQMQAEADDPPPARDTEAGKQEAEARREAEERAARMQAQEDARRQADALALQQQAEATRRQEEAERAAALEAQQREDDRLREEARQLALEAEARRQAEEEARRQAEALALQKQREDALRREREDIARRAVEREERQREEARRLQAEQAQRDAMELQAKKQAEEIARQQAAVLERERQARDMAARRQAEAETTAARGRERDPELVLGDRPGDTSRNDALPRNLLGGGLAGRALEQARRPDVLRDAPLARQADGGTDAPRRRSIFGSNDKDVGLMMYVESWRLKIERNGGLNYPKSSVEKAHGDPVVTVSIRSDGSVEDVVIHRSSGRPELDEAVHRIVRINARYSAFPPELARRFDVIEIRRVWNFDSRLRILEEVR